MTEAQKRFCDEYLIDLNATRAYKVAYPNCKKDETASQAGSRLLRNVKVQAYIQARQKEIQEKTQITQEKIIAELAAIAFANGTDYSKIVKKKAIVPKYDEDKELIGYEEKEYMDVEFKETDELSEQQKKAITGIKYGKHGIQVDLCDKKGALELLGKHLGMFKESVKFEQDKPFEVNITVREK